MANEPTRVLVPDIANLRFPHGEERNYPIRFLFGKTMGTSWRCNVVVPPDSQEDRIVAIVTDALSLVIDQMSHWDPASALSRFNRSPAGTWHRLPAEFYCVLESALNLAKQSGGVYDPTIGELVRELGFGPDQPETILWNPADLLRLRDKCGWDRLILNPEGYLVLQPGGLQLDLSSIAKGFAVDLVSERLLSTGLYHFLFEIGGEFRGEGCKPNGMPWWIELEKPTNSLTNSTQNETEPIRIAASGLSVASSGHKFHCALLPNGERISHLINAKNGDARLTELASVSVIDRSCMIADGWATTLFAAGLSEGMKLAEQFRIAAIFTTNENLQWESSAISTFLT